MSKVIKQYTIEKAYIDNYRIEQFLDGVLSKSNIVEIYNLTGYTTILEDQGYERAYDLDYYREEMEDARTAYEEAQEEYKRACEHPLIKKGG